MASLAPSDSSPKMRAGGRSPDRRVLPSVAGTEQPQGRVSNLSSS